MSQAEALRAWRRTLEVWQTQYHMAPSLLLEFPYFAAMFESLANDLCLSERRMDELLRMMHNAQIGDYVESDVQDAFMAGYPVQSAIIGHMHEVAMATVTGDTPVIAVENLQLILEVQYPHLPVPPMLEPATVFDGTDPYFSESVLQVKNKEIENVNSELNQSAMLFF